VSAIALVVLVPWFLITLIGAVRGGYEGALAYLSDPLNAVVVILAVSAALYHMRLGMQVVIEDYIGKPGLRISLLVLNTFVCIALFATAAYAVLKIAIS
jgi:succinate dehydrogenase / fumarate reductase membrane anchor subunit